MEEENKNLIISMTNISKDVEYIKQSLTENKEDHLAMMKRIDDWIDSSNKRFAPKWAADILKWAGAIVGAVVLTAVISLVIK